jgi:hypothetical protein
MAQSLASTSFSVPRAARQPPPFRGRCRSWFGGSAETMNLATEGVGELTNEGIRERQDIIWPMA